jgi:hypothetical protein
LTPKRHAYGFKLDGALPMKRKPESDSTSGAKPLREFWRGEGNRKIPAITLPRVRALETSEPDEQPDGRPSK